VISNSVATTDVESLLRLQTIANSDTT